MYIHVCIMFRHVYTVLPYPVQGGRIPDVCTFMVQGGTKWYKVVHDGTRNGMVYGGTWRYVAVQESVKLYILVCTGTYLFLRFNLVPAGFAAAMLPGRRRCIEDQCI